MAVGSKGRKWHFRSLFLEFALIAPSIYCIRFLGYLTPARVNCCLAGAGLLLATHAYGIFGGHTGKIEAGPHRKKVAGPGCVDARAERNKDPRGTGPEHRRDPPKRGRGGPRNKDEQNAQANSIQGRPINIQQSILQEITAWDCVEYDYGGGISYVVCNAYYRDLFFAFENQDAAHRFMAQLQQLNGETIVRLARSPAEATKLKRKFLRDDLALQMYYRIPRSK